MLRRALFAFVLALGVPGGAHAIAIQVDWSADVSVNGFVQGTLSGSLGVFQVTAPGDVFQLPGDGSLTAIATGFLFPGLDSPPDSPYQHASFEPNGPTQFRFDSLSPIAGQLEGGEYVFVFQPCGNNQPPFVAGTNCRIVLHPSALAAFEIDGPSSATWSGPIQFQYTAVPEPRLALCWIGVAAALAVRARHRTS